MNLPEHFREKYKIVQSSKKRNNVAMIPSKNFKILTKQSIDDDVEIYKFEEELEKEKDDDSEEEE